MGIIEDAARNGATLEPLGMLLPWFGSTAKVGSQISLAYCDGSEACIPTKSLRVSVPQN